MDRNENCRDCCTGVASRDPSPVRVERTDFVAFSGVFGALILAGFAQAHQVVYGTPDALGIHFRRYFRWKHVNWDQIESISTRHLMNTIHVDTTGNGFFDQRLVFVRDTVVFGQRSKSLTFEDLRDIWLQAKRDLAEREEHPQSNPST